MDKSLENTCTCCLIPSGSSASPAWQIYTQMIKMIVEMMDPPFKNNAAGTSS
jgi:hypothetical protein